MNCGCKPEYSIDPVDGEYATGDIVFCPLHESAEGMTMDIIKLVTEIRSQCPAGHLIKRWVEGIEAEAIKNTHNPHQRREGGRHE